MVCCSISSTMTLPDQRMCVAYLPAMSMLWYFLRCWPIRIHLSIAYKLTDNIIYNKYFFSFLPLKISFSYCSAGLTLINLALCYVSTGNMWPINETRLMVCWWFELAGVSLFFVQNLVNLPILCMATIIPARLRSFSQWFHSDLYSRRMS